MKNVITKIIDQIKLAVEQKNNIIIRHHDDTDGYIAGLLLEKICNTLGARHITRVASKTPFYDYGDCLRDINMSMRHNDQLLVIAADLGSNNQSIAALKKLKQFGATIIIIDHHEFEDENAQIANVYLNPIQQGLTGDYCTGLLTSLIAQEVMDVAPHFAALALIADKSSGQIVDEYVEKSALSVEEIYLWSIFTDHECFYARFTLATSYLDHMFSKEHLMSHLQKSKEINQELQLVQDTIKKYIVSKDCGSVRLLHISKDVVFPYSYASSKLVRLVHESIKEPHVTISSNDYSLSLRSSDDRFSVLDLLHYLVEQFSPQEVSGGGHKSAGGIHFIPVIKDALIIKVEEFLAQL